MEKLLRNVNKKLNDTHTNQKLYSFTEFLKRVKMLK